MCLSARLLHHCHHSSLSVLVLLKERLPGLWMCLSHIWYKFTLSSSICRLYILRVYICVCVWWWWGICPIDVSGRSLTHVQCSICSQLLTHSARHTHTHTHTTLEVGEKMDKTTYSIKTFFHMSRGCSLLTNNALQQYYREWMYYYPLYCACMCVLESTGSSAQC